MEQFIPQILEAGATGLAAFLIWSQSKQNQQLISEIKQTNDLLFSIINELIKRD